MSHIFHTEAPIDAVQQLEELEGAKLLSYFRSLPWNDFLDGHLRELSPTDIRLFVGRVASALDNNVAEDLIVKETADVDDLMSVLRVVYGVMTPEPRGLKDIICDVKRAWHSSPSELEGRKAVGASLSAVFIKESNHNTLRSLGREIDALGLKCDEVPSKNGNPQRFFTPSIRKSETVKRLLAFWSSSVPETTARGFIGRYWGMNHRELAETFKERWTEEMLGDVEIEDLKKLAEVMCKEGTPLSPSASGARLFLEKIMRQDISKSQTSDENDLERQHIGSPSHLRPTVRLRRPTKTRTTKTALDASSSSSSESGGHILSEDSDSDFESHYTKGKSVGPRLGFRGLPKRMSQVLVQGGRDFEVLFEPLQVEVTTVAELRSLLRYFKANQMLTSQLCRANGLTEDPASCANKLQRETVHVVRPEHRIETQLSFPPAARRAPMEIRRWLTHGSIIPWVEKLQAKAGPVEKDNADGYLAREIMVVGMALAAILDECHPKAVVYLAGVERLVRRLLVIEKALTLDRKERGAFYEKQLSFMGIGGGALPSTAELL